MLGILLRTFCRKRKSSTEGNWHPELFTDATATFREGGASLFRPGNNLGEERTLVGIRL